MIVTASPFIKPLSDFRFMNSSRQLMTQDTRIFKIRLCAFKGMKIGAANTNTFYFKNGMTLLQEQG